MSSNNKRMKNYVQFIFLRNLDLDKTDKTDFLRIISIICS
jgi:hypothetical protein